jgi:hypothetical protein
MRQERVYAPAPGKQTLYHRATGTVIERWPVDAAELLATGAYTTDPSEAASADAVPVPPVVEEVAPVEVAEAASADATANAPKAGRRGAT